MILKYSVGLDVSSKKIDLCLSTIDELQRVRVKSTKVIPNTLKGFKKLEFWIKTHRKDKDVPLYICMEATGVYHELCALYLYEKGFTISVILPNKANKYLQAIGLRSKNDTIDAKGLAQMGAEQNLKKWEPMGRYFYELRTYTRQYQNLQENKTAINNQIHALELTMYQSKKVLRQLRKLIKLFDEQLKELTELITEHIASNSNVSQKVENICKIKGLATLTVATVLAETNGFELFENYKQLVSFAGYDIIERQSGTKQGKTKISKQGNSRIRRALFMPAFSVVIWKQKPFIDLYNRTFEKHGIKMKSYVAVQKKLLIIIYALWKNREAFDENHQRNSPTITSRTIQDSYYQNNFSNESQMYKYLIKNETAKDQAKKIYSHS